MCQFASVRLKNDQLHQKCHNASVRCGDGVVTNVTWNECVHNSDTWVSCSLKLPPINSTVFSGMFRLTTKQNIKVPYYWPFLGVQPTGRFPSQRDSNAQCHVMKSSCFICSSKITGGGFSRHCRYLWTRSQRHQWVHGHRTHSQNTTRSRLVLSSIGNDVVGSINDVRNHKLSMKICKKHIIFYSKLCTSWCHM